jgi:hypothetical protein
MARYVVHVTGINPVTGERDEGPSSIVYAASADEAEKIDEARAQARGIDNKYFQYTAEEYPYKD